MTEINEDDVIKLDYRITHDIDNYLGIFSLKVTDFDFFTAPLLIKNNEGRRISLSDSCIKDIHHIVRILLSRNRSNIESKTMVKIVFKKITLNRYRIVLSDLDLVGERDINLELAMGLFTEIIDVVLEYNTNLPMIVSIINNKDAELSTGFITSSWEECKKKLTEFNIDIIDSMRNNKFLLINTEELTVTITPFNTYSLNQFEVLKSAKY